MSMFHKHAWSRTADSKPERVESDATVAQQADDANLTQEGATE